MKPTSSQAGYTLAELLIYIGITTAIVVTLTAFVSDVSLQMTRSKIDRAVQDNGRLLISKLTYDIRTADTVTVVSPEQLTISRGGATVTYRWNAADGTVYYDDGGGVLAPLSSDRIRVTNLAFTAVNEAVSVALSVAQEHPTTPASTQRSISLHSSVAPRAAVY